jgi:hypothetical protein
MKSSAVKGFREIIFLGGNLNIKISLHPEAEFTE